jgi:sensor histidine kinase YesM
MMAQPFIENAIEHGIRHKETKGYIKVSIQKTGKNLTWFVKDDGVGRKNAKELSKRKNHKSMATSLTLDRLKILSKKEKQKFLLEIKDLVDTELNPLGTQVMFSVPFREMEG